MMVRVLRCAAQALVVLAASISIPACAMDEDLDPSTESECSPIEEGAKDHDLLVEIEAMGLCASTAVDLGDEYLVEGDIAVPKERLRDKQRRSGTLVTIGNVEWITVRVDAAVPLAWRTATQDAIAAWNNVTATAVRFQFTSAATANIRVVDDGGVLSDSDGVVADAFFPSNGLAGDRIRINQTFNGLSANSKLYALAHELGHTIGLDHTDNGTGALIPGTPMTEAASVMNAFLGTWAGFSTGDIDAVRALYPFRVNSLTAEYTGCHFGVPKYLINWGPSEGGVIDWQLQRRSGNTYVNHYQGPNIGISFNGSSNINYAFRVRANTILGPTAWKLRGFQAPDCSDDPPNPL